MEGPIIIKRQRRDNAAVHSDDNGTTGLYAGEEYEREGYSVNIVHAVRPGKH